MSDKLALCMVGCGGMGSRHLRGLASLARTGLSNIELVAVCDVREDNAKRAAAEAEELLGRRPAVHLSMAKAIADPAIQAFDIVTDASSHAAVVVPALQASKAVLCEKPLGLTVRSCRAMIDAAAANTVLATAENYRRDPPNRLVRAVLEAGLLGHVHLMNQFSVGGDDKIIITPWRHDKHRGAIGMDMGVHYADIIQYYLGPFESAAGDAFMAEPIRHRRAKPEMDTPAYRERLAEMPETVIPTGEDSVVANFRMQSGVLVQMAYVPSGPGERWWQRSLHGRLGSLSVPRDRTGGAPVLQRADGILRGREILRELPDFTLDEVTSRIFGDNAVEYTIPFNDADAGHIAIEMHDFARAVLEGGQPEIDGWGGLTAVAAVLAAFESGIAGRTITLSEILDGSVSAYQDEIDRAQGLL